MLKNKIAILSDTFPPLNSGGIANAHYNLYKKLKENGYTVKVFTYLDKKEHIQKISKVENISRFGASNNSYRLISILLFFYYKLRRVIFGKKMGSKLSYQFNIVALSNIGSWKINKKLKLFNPDFVIIPDFGAPAFLIKKIEKAQYIYISHHNPMRFLGNPLIGEHSESDARLATWFEQKSLKKMDIIICPSDYMKEVFENTFKIDCSVSVIPNIVDEQFIESIQKIDLHKILKIDRDCPIIYIPSAGSKIKGAKYLIEILKKINSQLDRNVAFFLSGELSDKHKTKLDALKENFIIFAPGKLTYRLNIAYVKSCTICLSPTLLESFGMAILEALICNLPCISFDVGANKELIVDGKNGFIVPYLDIEQLIKKTVLVIQNKNLLSSQDSIAKQIESGYSSEAITKKYLSIFKNKGV